MANIFLDDGFDEIETAILWDKAYIQDIGHAVAYTDGTRVFVNTDDNLSKILPAYSKDMLKWILWHERYHNELTHHKRYNDYIEKAHKDTDPFQVTADEVNIIMDILVHDILSRLFPELVETAEANLSQMRDKNSLKYTFKTFTLEEMLDEYRAHKAGEDKKDEKEEDDKDDKDEKGEKEGDKEKESDPSDMKTHKKGGKEIPKETDLKDDKPIERTPKEKEESEPEDRHDEVDWSALHERSDREFIETHQADRLINASEKLRRTKINLGRLTRSLNGLVTTTRERTYRRPSYIHVHDKVVLKGKTPGRTALYLCFDASGSMGRELSIFKEVISKSIPQAMHVPCEWFSGRSEDCLDLSEYHNKDRREYDYYKGKFKDIMNITASNGYGDDGDRTIELCWEAEQKGYSPIGVTDGGGGIYWTEDKIKQLKRTVLVGQNPEWLDKVKNINPNIQTISLED